MNSAIRLLLFLLCSVSIFAQGSVDEATIARIRTEGLERSQVLETFHQLVTTIGPRLTNSPAHRRSVEWTQERLKAIGLVNVHAEPFPFGRGWTLERFSIEMIEPNVGEHGTVFATGRDPGPGGVPSVVLASEHYNVIARLVEQEVPVRLAVDVQGRYQEQDTNALNAIAEIAGVDPVLKDEIVMVGAHLDSWHTSDGATDNADGVATAIEALRFRDRPVSDWRGLCYHVLHGCP